MTKRVGQRRRLVVAKQSIYKTDDVKKFLKNRHIVVIGDSVQRGTYKDIVLALQDERHLTQDELKAKGEDNFLNDVLVYRSELTNGKEYNEVREFQSADGFHLVQFYFVTRCYDDRMEMIFREFKLEMPDLIIMNSCMWDTARYGLDGEQQYQENMKILFSRLQEILPLSTTFIWLTAPPLASRIVGGFLLDEIQFMSETLRISILEANYFISQLAIQFGFDVLDVHFYLRPFIRHRQDDGVHWDGFACRHVTDLILTFLFDSYKLPLPEHTAREALRCNNDTKVQSNLNTRVFNRDGYPAYIEELIAELSKDENMPVDGEEWEEEGDMEYDGDGGDPDLFLPPLPPNGESVGLPPLPPVDIEESPPTPPSSTDGSTEMSNDDSLSPTMPPSI